MAGNGPQPLQCAGQSGHFMHIARWIQNLVMPRHRIIKLPRYGTRDSELTRRSLAAHQHARVEEPFGVTMRELFANNRQAWDFRRLVAHAPAASVPTRMSIEASKLKKLAA